MAGRQVARSKDAEVAQNAKPPNELYTCGSRDDRAGDAFTDEGEESSLRGFALAAEPAGATGTTQRSNCITKKIPNTGKINHPSIGAHAERMSNSKLIQSKLQPTSVIAPLKLASSVAS